jgi:hypothetical protein
VRAYWGASHTGRNPNPFTGFDPHDDLALKEMRQDNCYSGPFPIVNTTLNAVSGKDLAWQERKAESFVMTPLRCGFDVWLEQMDLKKGSAMGRPKSIEMYRHRPTENFLYENGGPRVGAAVSIIGRGSSPNMGYHSLPSLAFLMTFFNVRLGYWAGNPRNKNTWTKPGPMVGLLRLLAELFGQTDDEARYVYLSDGGHFENLGVRTGQAPLQIHHRLRRRSRRQLCSGRSGQCCPKMPRRYGHRDYSQHAESQARQRHKSHEMALRHW